MGEIVTVYDEGQPRGLWRVGRIEEVIPGSDGNVRSARVHVQSKTGQATVLRRPIQYLYPLEICCEDSVDLQPERARADKDIEDNEGLSTLLSKNQDYPHAIVETPRGGRPAAIEARDRILGCVTD